MIGSDAGGRVRARPPSIPAPGGRIPRPPGAVDCDDSPSVALSPGEIEPTR